LAFFGDGVSRDAKGVGNAEYRVQVIIVEEWVIREARQGRRMEDHEVVYPLEDRKDAAGP